MADVLIEVKGTREVELLVREWRDQAPYALSIALNRTAEDVLSSVRAQIQAAFVVRRPDFILPPQILPREWRANKQNLSALVGLGSGGAKKLGERRRAILEPFEEGRPKTIGKLPVAIPTRFLRPNFRDLVPRRMYPAILLGTFDSTGLLTGLGTKARTRGKKKKPIGSYFTLGGSTDRSWGVYQRVGPQSFRRLWTFKTIVPRPPRLRFYDTASRVFDQRWEANVVGAFNVAIRTR